MNTLRQLFCHHLWFTNDPTYKRVFMVVTTGDFGNLDYPGDSHHFDICLKCGSLRKVINVA